MTTDLQNALKPVLDHLEHDIDPALERLFALMRFPSISTDDAYAQACAEAADWLVGDLAQIGFDVQSVATPGHPIVLGHHDGPGPHVLFYGHYDVQPVDPLDLWTHDPFDPKIIRNPDGTRIITGRGASDDKGQLMTFVEACRAWKTVTGALPCKTTILIEGEEESGGHSLPAFLRAHAKRLDADIALVCDTGMWDAETPAITTMLRGNLADEVTIHAANRDLHSGFYGGAARNPIHVLGTIIGALHDENGRVTIPGFYAQVPDIPREIRTQWQGLDFSDADFLGNIGLSHPAGETGFSTLEQVWARPTVEVNGIWGGYTGAGFKTVIPATASAKISFRLVGQQEPETIRTGFRQFVRDHLPPDCRAEFTPRDGGPAITMPLENPMFASASAALSAEWGRETAFIGCGGSIPVVALLKQMLGIDSMLIGFGLDDDRIHSPNEKYNLTSYTHGARSWARILDALASQSHKRG